MHLSHVERISTLESEMKRLKEVNEALIIHLKHNGVEVPENLCIEMQGEFSEESEQHATANGDLGIESAEREEERRENDSEIKTPGEQNTKLVERAKVLEIKWLVEAEENQRLKAEVKELRDFLDVQSSVGDLESSNEEGRIDDYKKALSAMKRQVKHFDDDATKLREHSKDQSRQILKYRQQAEMTEVRN